MTLAFASRTRGAFGECNGGGQAQPVSGQALLAAEIAGHKDCDHSFLSGLGYHQHLDLAGLDIKNAVRSIALGKDNLILVMFCLRPSAV